MEIKWHDIDSETGRRRFLCAERFAGDWRFRWKLQRRGDWTRGLQPTKAMWEIMGRPVGALGVDAAAGICLWLGQKLLKRLPIVRFPAFQEAGRCTLGGSALQRLVGHR